MAGLRAIDRLILIRVKTEWAKKRLSDLAAESLTLDHTHILVRDEDTGVAPHPLTIYWGDVPTVPVIKFDAVCLAGEVINSLRAALDHLAQHLALVNTPTLTDKELRGVEFPIAEVSTKYETEKARKVKGIHPDAIKAIESLKPYGDGDGEFSAVLWRLHALDNIDKHRSLFTFGPEFVFTSDWFSGTYYFKTDDPHFSGLEADVEKYVQSAIKETAGKTQVEYLQALLPTLRQFVEVVDEVIERFERFLG